VTLREGAGAGARRGWVLPTLLALLLGGLGLVIARGSRRRTPDAGTAALLAMANASPRTTPAPQDYHLEVLGLPADARIEINGSAVVLPASIRAGENVRIAITAPGFDPWSQTVVPTGDLALTYEGRRTPLPTPASSVADAGSTTAHTDATQTTASRRNSRGNTTRRTRSGDAGVRLERGVAGRPDF
jgi:hypothetical protein